jgi:O-antigen/teichoic acid export membrane protein
VRFPSISSSELLRSTGSLATGTLATATAEVVSRLALAAFLGLSGYGQLAIIASLTAVFQQFFDLRVGTFATVYLTKYISSQHWSKAVSVLKLAYLIDAMTGLLAYTLLFVLAPWLLDLANQPVDAAPYIRLFGLGILLTTLEMSTLSLLKAAAHYKYLTFVTTGPPLIQATFATVAAWLTHDLLVVIGAMVIGSAVATVTHIVVARFSLRKVGLRLSDGSMSDTRSEWREYRRLLFHTNFIGYSAVVLTKLDAIVLGRFVPIDTVGLYRLAVSAVNLVGLPASAVQNGLLQIFTRHLATGGKSLFRIARQATWLAVGPTFIGGASLIVFGQWVLAIFIDESLDGFRMIATVLVLAQLLKAASGFVTPLLLAIGMSARVGWLAAISLVVYPLALVGMTMTLGAVGAAWALVITTAITGFIGIGWSLRRVKALGLD